jgi:hypothetical protein
MIAIHIPPRNQSRASTKGIRAILQILPAGGNQRCQVAQGDFRHVPVAVEVMLYDDGPGRKGRPRQVLMWWTAPAPGIDANEKVVVRKQLRRSQVIAFFAALTPCLIGMEACASAHYWARELTKLGHKVRLMMSVPPPPSEVALKLVAVYWPSRVSFSTAAPSLTVSVPLAFAP